MDRPYQQHAQPNHQPAQGKGQIGYIGSKVQSTTHVTFSVEAPRQPIISKIRTLLAPLSCDAAAFELFDHAY